MSGGKCRYCGCTQYKLNCWQGFNRFDASGIGVRKGSMFFGCNPQPNQIETIIPCVCGHLKNNHY